MARRTHRQLAASQIHKIRDPRTNQLITEPEDIERTFQRDYEELYTQLESKQDSSLCANTLDLPKKGQTQNDVLTRDISIEEEVEAINT